MKGAKQMWGLLQPDRRRPEAPEDAGPLQALPPNVQRALMRAALLATPLLLLALVFLSIAWVHPDIFRRAYGLILVFMFTPAGKFTAAAFIGAGFGVWETVFILGSVDVLVGAFLVLNFDTVHRIPRLGPWLQRIEEKGAELLADRGWVRKAALGGLALIVAIPFQGTGSIVGAVLGRILGLGMWRTLLAIAIGGYGGIAIVAGAAQGVASVARQSLGLGVVLTGLLVAGLIVALVYWRRKRALAVPEAP